jgi:hypothetical protein
MGIFMKTEEQYLQNVVKKRYKITAQKQKRGGEKKYTDLINLITSALETKYNNEEKNNILEKTRELLENKLETASFEGAIDILIIYIQVFVQNTENNTKDITNLVVTKSLDSLNNTIKSDLAPTISLPQITILLTCLSLVKADHIAPNLKDRINDTCISLCKNYIRYSALNNISKEAEYAINRMNNKTLLTIHCLKELKKIFNLEDKKDIVAKNQLTGSLKNQHFKKRKPNESDNTPNYDQIDHAQIIRTHLPDEYFNTSSPIQGPLPQNFAPNYRYFLQQQWLNQLNSQRVIF